MHCSNNPKNHCRARLSDHRADGESIHVRFESLEQVRQEQNGGKKKRHKDNNIQGQNNNMLRKYFLGHTQHLFCTIGDFLLPPPQVQRQQLKIFFFSVFHSV